MKRTVLAPALKPPGSDGGFVLAIVLVMLVLMTLVVMMTIRRGTVDERLAANARGVVAMELAAGYALRYCELMVTLSPPGRAPAPGLPPPPRTIVAPASGEPAAWRNAAHWDLNGSNPDADSVVLQPGTLGPEVQRGECLIEDASAELDRWAATPTVANNATEPEAAWRKYRITAEVEGRGPDGLRIARAQSELRISAD